MPVEHLTTEGLPYHSNVVSNQLIVPHHLTLFPEFLLVRNKAEIIAYT